MLPEGFKDRIARVPEKPHGLGVWNKTTWLASWVLKIAQCFPISACFPQSCPMSLSSSYAGAERTLLCLAASSFVTTEAAHTYPPPLIWRRKLLPALPSSLLPSRCSVHRVLPSVQLSTARRWASKATDKQIRSLQVPCFTSFRDNAKTITLQLESLHLLSFL